MTNQQLHSTDRYQQLRHGFIANLVVAASVAAYGSVLGLLAAQKGLTWYQLLVMNLSVFAGSAQFVMVEMWLPPLPILEITLAVLVINMRYMLIGASLNPLFQGKSLRHKFLFMHLVADENWAITMARYHQGTASTWFLLGGGLCVQTAWCGGTMIGHRLGAIIQNPEQYGLDFAFVAVFTALVFSFWEGKKDILPWLVAAIVALISESMLPGKWYIVCGGISGALIAAFIKNSEGKPNESA
ncbi:MAG: branched-chain amino acid ABC transporter permease [Desulfobulbaceae bacterium]|nr:MAG: branched-chain amino acid ABC transporter permease [Desulfobulbaceae bacterium]